jgi:hypothetical protein
VIAILPERTLLVCVGCILGGAAGDELHALCDSLAAGVFYQQVDGCMSPSSPLKNITKDWKMSAREWKSTMNQFAILFADRFMPQLH